MNSLRFAGYQPSHSVHSKSSRYFREALGALTGDELAIQLTENITAAGAPMTSLPVRAAAGELDMFYIASSYLVQRCPPLAVLDLPFPGKDRSDLFQALDHGDLGRRLAGEISQRTEFRLLGFWDNGLRHLSNAVRPILTPDDCLGLRIRTLDSAFHQAVFSAMGFDPRFVDMKDFPAAIATGTVDAQDNPLTNLITFGVQHHHRYVSLTGHFQGVVLVLANAAWFDGLPGSIRKNVIETLAAATAFQRQLAVEEDVTCHEALITAGVEIAGSQSIDLAAFRDCVRPLVDEMSEILGSELIDMAR